MEEEHGDKEGKEEQQQKQLNERRRKKKQEKQTLTFCPLLLLRSFVFARFFFLALDLILSVSNIKRKNRINIQKK